MNRMRIIFPVLIFSAVSFAQSQTDPGKAPATKLDAFQSRTGIVIQGYSEVGTFSSMQGSVTVFAEEFRNGTDPNSLKAAGVGITVTETGRGNTSYVDADEIDSLASGIEYISKVSKEVTKLDLFHVDYRTKGNLVINVSNSPKGAMSASVSCGTTGQRAYAYITVEQLTKLHDLILAAKAKL